MSRDWGHSKQALLLTAAFLAGSVFTLLVTRTHQVHADSNRVFELRIYHALPGKLPVLESRFRDTTSKLLAKHNLNIVGYWMALQDPSPYWNDTFIFMVSHSSKEEAQKNWAALDADPAFQELIKSEQASPTVTKVERTYMQPTDFSPTN